MTPQDFFTLVSSMITAAQARASVIIDTTVGSITRAIIEATSGVALWLQALIFQLLQKIRAATATGADLDSWMADYGVVTRIQAIGASGIVTFARFTTGFSATVPFGAIVQTAGGSQRYAVTIDTTNAYYTSGGYVLGPSVASAGLPVTAVTAGAGGNVGAGLVNLLGQAIPYIDTVKNAAAMAGGADAESDATLRARFTLTVNGLGGGTLAAIEAAIESISPSLTFKVIENADAFGNPHVGYFYAYIDDGSGAVPSGTITSIANAIDLVRAFTVQFAVVAAAPLTANVVQTIIIAAGYSSAPVLAAVIAAVTGYINSQPVGTTLYYAQLGVIAGGVLGVQAVASTTLNGGTSNLVPTAAQVVHAGSITATAV